MVVLPLLMSPLKIPSKREISTIYCALMCIHECYYSLIITHGFVIGLWNLGHSPKISLAISACLPFDPFLCVSFHFIYVDVMHFSSINQCLDDDTSCYQWCMYSTIRINNIGVMLSRIVSCMSVLNITTKEATYDYQSNSTKC
jgi:hypothetical protein